MSLARYRWLSAIVAIAAIGGEVALGLQARLPLFWMLPLAVATGGFVLGCAVALEMLFGRRSRGLRTDVGRLFELHRAANAAIEAQGERLAQTEARIRLLAAEPDLARAEAALARVAEQVETWETPETDLPRWSTAVSRWSAIVAGLDPALRPDPSPATDAELRGARAQLPPTRNFSSAELKVAMAYIVQRERIIAAHERLGDYRAALLG